MGQETNAALRRKLRTQRAAYEELLGLAGAIMAALCVRRGDGGTLRLPQQDAALPHTCARREEQHRKMGKSSKVNITSLIAPRLC